MDQCHRILQLVAEAERAAGLVIAAARPHAAGQGLIQQPAVGQHIERFIRRFHLHRAQAVVPELPDVFQRSARGMGATETLHQTIGIFRAWHAAHTKPEHDLARLPVAQIDADLKRGAGVQPAAQLAGKMRAAQRRRVFQAAVATDEFGAVAGKTALRIVDIEEGDTAGEFGVVGIARVDRAAGGIDFGGDVHRGLRPQIAQHPFHITGGRQTARTAGLVAQFEDGEFHRRVGGDINP